MGFLSFFKRKPAADQGSAEDVQRARSRARQRLIGAVVLVALAVIGLPLLLDTAPRPVAADLPIEIPRKEAVAPLPVPAAPPRSSSTPAAAAKSGPPAVASATAPTAGEAAVKAPAAAPVARAELPPEPREDAPATAATKASAPGRPPTKAAADEPKPVAKPAVPSDGARAAALLAGGEAAAGDGRYVVQVGAFAESAGAREARAKVEKLGLKTYTQVVETKEGKRIRVRVGPYAARADADKAAAQLRASGLGAAVLTL